MRAQARPLAAIVAGTLVVETLMVLTDMGPRLVLVGALGGVVGTAAWFALDLRSATVQPPPMPPPRTSSSAQHADWRGASLRSGLAAGRRDSLTADRLHGRLVAIVDDELAAVHGVDRHADPAAAAAIMGPELTAFVTDPSSARWLSRPRRLAHVLTLIERIGPPGA